MTSSTSISDTSIAYTLPVDELNLILERVSSPMPGPIAVIGLPGVGKTSLLRFISDAAPSTLGPFLRSPYRSKPELLLPVLVSFRTIGKAHAFARMLTALLERLRGYSHMSVTPPDVPDSLTLSAADAAETMEAVLESCEREGIRPVLLLDDFDRTFKELHATDAARLRPQRAAALVVAIENPLEMSNEVASTSPFFQLVQYVWMRGLPSPEAAHLVASVAGAPASDADYLARQVIPYPLVLEKSAQILRDERTRRGLPATTPLDDGMRALLTERLQDELKGTFEYYWTRLDARQKEVLRALSDGTQPTSEEGSARAFLENRGLIDYLPSTQKYRVRGTLFSEFVTRQHRRPTGLSDFESELYDYLRSQLPNTCTVEELFENVWKTEGKSSPSAARRVQVAISRLRRKLEAGGRETIVNVREQGYRLETS
jgi:hypothetical protein